MDINHAKGSFDYLSDLVKKLNNNKTKLCQWSIGPSHITIENTSVDGYIRSNVMSHKAKQNLL